MSARKFSDEFKRDELRFIRNKKFAYRVFGWMAILMVTPIFIIGSIYSFAYMNLDFFNIADWSAESRGWYAAYFWASLPVVCVLSSAAWLQDEAEDEKTIADD